MPESSYSVLHNHAQIHEDLARLQGVWVSVVGQRPAELLVAGNFYTFKFEDGAVYRGTFELDTDATPEEKFELDLDDDPRAMDMFIADGPMHAGKKALCIYELYDDVLRWSPGEPGSGRRPTAFPSDQDKRALCLLFRRGSMYSSR